MVVFSSISNTDGMMKAWRFYTSLAVSLLLLFASNLTGQTVAHHKAVYQPGFSFVDGVYISLQDFRDNHPIPVDRIVSQFDKADSLFLQNVLTNRWFYFADKSGLTDSVQVKELWGACHRGKVFIQYRHKFSFLDVIGKICEFNNYQTPGQSGISFYPPQQGFVGQSVLRYYLDFYTGEVLPYNKKNFKKLIADDKKFLNNFQDSKRNLEDLPIFRHYYNEDHPIYFPVN